jgi:hypothetical protein
MARRFWPGEDPVGKRFKYGLPDVEDPWKTIVGVVGDARRTALEQPARPSTYLPYPQRATPAMTLVLRTSLADPRSLAKTVRREVWALDKNAPITEVATLEELLGERLSQRRINAQLLGLFSLLARPIRRPSAVSRPCWRWSASRRSTSRPAAPQRPTRSSRCGRSEENAAESR